MGHEGHAHEEKPLLSFFASPLHKDQHGHVEHAPGSSSSSDTERQKAPNANDSPFEYDHDYSDDPNPSFHKHAEATTIELFYDLFFVANLTTFTSMLEINDSKSLTAYVGFFSLLWLTWYSVSLYDVRFSADSVFERLAKAFHFGVMVGFAVMGPQWKPGQAQGSFTVYRAFGWMLMVSRLTLVCQYGVTLIYSRKYKKTVVPLAAVMASHLLAAILYGGLTAVFPSKKFDLAGKEIYQTSNAYIAWYVIGIIEIMVTVGVSMYWRIISFKGTHMVQRMSLLTLIILGEGIIVVCKSISKIVKNDYAWTGTIVGQIVASVAIIYFLYMLYFDWMQEEHFGSIKQQIWSFLHFPLHVTLVLVLQGISLLIIWLQTDLKFRAFYSDITKIVQQFAFGGAAIATTQQSGAPVAKNGAEFMKLFNQTIYKHVYNYIPKGVDVSKELSLIGKEMPKLAQAYDALARNTNNATAQDMLMTSVGGSLNSATKTLFDTFSVSIPPEKMPKGAMAFQPDAIGLEYVKVFGLVFTYVFVAGGLALLVTTMLGFLSLPARERKVSTYIRLGIQAACPIALCLLSVIKYHELSYYTYLASPWVIPTLCLVYFFNVIVTHARLPHMSKAQ